MGGSDSVLVACGIGVLITVIGVLVGKLGGRVEVGREVGGTAVLVAVGFRSRSRASRVSKTNCVGVWVGVRVCEGVAEGMAGVAVGVSVGVPVGRVDVGKGPNRAWEVRARAVLVLSALLCAFRFPPELRLKAATESSRIKPIHKRMGMSRRRGA